MKNLRILVTGGTSGLGKALALEAARRGARVAIVSRSRERYDALARENPALELEWIQGDVSRKEDIHRISGQAAALLGGIDVLVNNASELGPVPLRLLLDTECEDFGRVLEANLLGPFRLAKAILPGMLLRRRGWVVNISSDAAVSAYPKWGAYGVSKAALDHLSRVWAAELEGTGVRFLAVDPGDMDTPMHAAAVPDADPATLRRPEDPAREILALIESGGPGAPTRRSLSGAGAEVEAGAGAEVEAERRAL